jgi:hypothetical protein
MQSVSNELIKRYKYISADVCNDIDSALAQMTFDDRALLWQTFLKEYTYKRIPVSADFIQLAKKHNIPLYPVRQAEYTGYCRDCGVYFRSSLHFCPLCKSEVFVMRERPIGKHKYFVVMPQCQYCAKHREHIQGTICESYGKLASQNLAACKTCPCAACCYEEFIYTNRPEEFKDRQGRGEFNGGFRALQFGAAREPQAKAVLKSVGIESDLF